MFGLIYLRLNYNQQGVMDMNGFLFLCICNNGFSTMFFVVNVRDLLSGNSVRYRRRLVTFFAFKSFPVELPIFLRDYENGMYRVLTYYASKLITDVRKGLGNAA